MKKLIEELKNSKYTCIVIIVFVVFIILCLGLYKFLFPNIGSPVYGNRLDGIQDVKITENEQKEIEDKIKEKEFVSSVSTSISGKTFNIIIKVKEDTSVDDAKSLTEIVKENIEKDQKKYYDIQVFLKNENEKKEGYPIIGYLGKTSTQFSYSSAS